MIAKFPCRQVLGLFIVFLFKVGCESPLSRESDLDSTPTGPQSTWIKSKGSGKILDLKDHGTKEGDLLQQWSDSKQSNQRFLFKPHGSQTYSIVSTRSGFCLELSEYSADDNSPVVQKKCSGETNQKWQIIEVPEGYLFKNTWNYKCLSVAQRGMENGIEVVIDQCTNHSHQFWELDSEFSFDNIIGDTPQPKQPSPEKLSPKNPQSPKSSRINFNPVIGVHTIKPAYQFSAENPIVESVKLSFKMGFRMVKLDADERAGLSTALSLPFTHVFLWFRTSKHWINGMTPEFKKKEYKETYQFAKTLLDNPTLAGRSIFIGHWEGDWLLLGEGFGDLDATEEGAKGMIAWINLRQQAIQDAKKASPESKVNIYHYVEVNRVRDAMVRGKKRLVDQVLPYVDVDYVSYSAYDVQQDTESTIHQTLDYIEKHLRPHPTIKGKRVFIGEFGIGLAGKSREEQDRLNQQFIKKFLSWGTPYLLYWSLYETKANMVPDRKYALIDENNQKIPFAITLENFLKRQLDFVRAKGQKGSVDQAEMMDFVRQEFRE